MLRTALTGGIGAGKSTIAQIFSSYGAHIVDADALGRELMQAGGKTFDEVIRLFGSDILCEDGSLNRGRLAQKIFSDEQLRETLERIMHPAIRERAVEKIANIRRIYGDDAIVIEDIPLLVETGQYHHFDKVIVVYADLPVRLERLKKYRGMSREDALNRMSAQASDAQRAEVAHWVIDNSGDIADTKQRVLEVWEGLLASSDAKNNQ
ncbi:dephospho-CoA kinase [Rothia sp. P7208]|uniref:dephospho-CoA kinase n=1 Tax=Rothia sp. P7208 TaxID=3402660 RepID=UPI003ACDC40A